MFIPFFNKTPRFKTVPALYKAIVAQSRHPKFYAEWSVPDTVTGRFDMISLHLALLLRRMRQEPDRTREFSQALFDWFFKDMDRSMREMGVGDLAIPKRIEKMGSLFYGLLGKLTGALDTGSGDALRGVLARNVLGDGQDAGGGAAIALAAYVQRATGILDAQPVDIFLGGAVVYGEVA